LRGGHAVWMSAVGWGVAELGSCEVYYREQPRCIRVLWCAGPGSPQPLAPCQ
jgi:hypothetical protein